MRTTPRTIEELLDLCAELRRGDPAGEDFLDDIECEVLEAGDDPEALTRAIDTLKRWEFIEPGWYRIRCFRSGGRLADQESWARRDGEELVLAFREEAEAIAREWTERMNAHPHGTAVFVYEVVRGP